MNSSEALEKAKREIGGKMEEKPAKALAEDASELNRFENHSAIDFIQSTVKPRPFFRETLGS